MSGLVRFALWYGTIASVVTVVFGLTFAYLYHTRTGGKWRTTQLGRHLMAFVLAPAGVLVLALVRALGGASLDTPWFLLVRLAMFTLVPVVYLRQIVIFLKVQKEKDSDTDQDH